MAFNKTFFLPPGTTLSNYLVISIEGKKLDGIKFKVDKKKKKRILNGEEAPPEYDIDIYMGETVKNRNIVVINIYIFIYNKFKYLCIYIFVYFRLIYTLSQLFRMDLVTLWLMSLLQSRRLKSIITIVKRKG